MGCPYAEGLGRTLFPDSWTGIPTNCQPVRYAWLIRK